MVVAEFIQQGRGDAAYWQELFANRQLLPRLPNSPRDPLLAVELA